MRTVIVESFRKRWEHVNAMTTTFADAVPDERWQSSPGEGFSPFCKQLRHMVCVRGVYNDGLRTKRIDFGRKHSFYQGALSRAELMRALAERHAELLSLLADVPENLDRPQIEFFGRRISCVDYLYLYVQHEAIHHGQWSLYAAHGGYPTPELWRLQWGLGEGSA